MVRPTASPSICKGPSNGYWDTPFAFIRVDWFIVELEIILYDIF